VEKGTVVGTWNTADAQERVKTLEPAIAELQTRLKAADAPGKKRLVAVVDKAEAAASAAQAAVDKATADAKGAQTPALAAATRRLAAAQAALTSARTAAGPPRAELEGELAKRTQELEQARSEIDHPTLLAPASGAVAALAVKAGEPVAADATVLRIDSTDSLKATVSTPEQSVQPGMTAELNAGHLTHHVTLEAGGVATLDNGKHALEPGQPCTASIAGTPHPVIHF
jgi:multidrug resistance efflux pump